MFLCGKSTFGTQPTLQLSLAGGLASVPPIVLNTLSTTLVLAGSNSSAYSARPPAHAPSSPSVSSKSQASPSAMVNEVAKAIQPFFCGGFSACFASICIHPIDLTKARAAPLYDSLSPPHAERSALR